MGFSGVHEPTVNSNHELTVATSPHNGGNDNKSRLAHHTCRYVACVRLPGDDHDLRSSAKDGEDCSEVAQSLVSQRLCGSFVEERAAEFEKTELCATLLQVGVGKKTGDNAAWAGHEGIHLAGVARMSNNGVPAPLGKKVSLTFCPNRCRRDGQSPHQRGGLP